MVKLFSNRLETQADTIYYFLYVISPHDILKHRLMEMAKTGHTGMGQYFKIYSVARFSFRQVIYYMIYT
jgi:hypothetical protein